MSQARCETALRQTLAGQVFQKTLVPRMWRKSIQSVLQGTLISSRPPVDLSGWPPFSRSVWKATAAIPRGETRSYQWVARRVGKRRGMQAVGQALKRNPVPLLVPCHRVIRASQEIGGFSGGRGWKEKLLSAEGAVVMGKKVMTHE